MPEPINPFAHLLREFKHQEVFYSYYDISLLNPTVYAQLPYSIRVLLESCIRNCDEFEIKFHHVTSVLNWATNQSKGIEVPFKPARVILQDFTGVPALVDFASMRDAMKRLGGDPLKINPICPVDLVVDHSVDVAFNKSPSAIEQNQKLEFEKNKERFQFLKWGSKSLKNMRIVPPGSGIIHQVNLEYLARVVFQREDGLLFPDSLVGTDSHTTMINGLGVVGWGVGGIEAEAVMLGQSISLVLPQVLGYKIIGKLSSMATSTDLVLTVTKHLRSIGVVGKFVEFFGSGVSQLSIADRATIANMCPEYGATVGYFPLDNHNLEYLKQTGRPKELVALVEEYLKRVKLLREYDQPNEDPHYSQIVELDLSQVEPCLSGPKRPQDKVPLNQMKQDFLSCLTSPVGFKGYGLSVEKSKNSIKFTYSDGLEYELGHGSVVIAAITSCTNTSNPSVMLGAGLLARNAVKAGLKVKPFIKTSLSPGSGVVTYYLKEAGVLQFLEKLDFAVVGYGCMTCIGNSGPLEESVSSAIEKAEIVATGVLSGNRNFEGRIHPSTRANYLASPMLVVAYALAGNVLFDFEKEPLGLRNDGSSVFLRDIWPSRQEITETEKKFVLPKMFNEVYSKVQTGGTDWSCLEAPSSSLFPWDPQSTYIKSPPFFENMTRELPKAKPIEKARVILKLGDSVTTDHISPAGSIARNSPAAKFLQEKGLQPKEYNSYGSRRGNDDVMARGTFANIRLVNKLIDHPGPKTIHVPSGELVDIFEASQRYKKMQIPLIVLAGKEYGSGSSRDWAAKGPYLLGIRAVIAESYERIHRSNLIGMGIMPLQFEEGQTWEGLGLTGHEEFDVMLPPKMGVAQKISVHTSTGKSFKVTSRFDTEVELMYFENGGILNYMIRKMM